MALITQLFAEIDSLSEQVHPSGADETFAPGSDRRPSS